VALSSSQCISEHSALGVDVYILGKQHLYDLDITTCRRCLQYVAVVSALGVDVCVFGKQHLHYLVVAAC
jgi:hypothetical protein